jgi:hypothetical protein
MYAKTYSKTMLQSEGLRLNVLWIRLGCSADGIADDGIANDPKPDQYVAATRVNWR